MLLAGSVDVARKTCGYPSIIVCRRKANMSIDRRTGLQLDFFVIHRFYVINEPFSDFSPKLSLS
jgi:hypothetical protein